MAKRRVALFCLAVALGSTLASTGAKADEKTPSVSDAKPNAEELTNQAYETYKKGEYPKALSMYQRAYQISAATPILFNIANIYDRKLHERDLAAEYYRRYLRAPDAEPDLVKRGNDRLAALKQEDEAVRRNAPIAPAPVAVPAPRGQETPAAPPDTKKISTLQIFGLGAAGVGVVGVAVGTIFGLSAISKNNAAGRECNGAACTNADGVSLTSSARQAATVSTIGFVAGGALLAGGLGLYLLAPKERGGVALRVAPQVGFQTAGVMLGGGWNCPRKAQERHTPFRADVGAWVLHCRACFCARSLVSRIQ